MSTAITLEFLNALYPEPFAALGGSDRPLAHRPELVVWSHSRRDRRSRCDWARDVERAAVFAARHRHKLDVHFGVALQDRRLAMAAARRKRRRVTPAGVRGTRATAVVLPALWMDLDVGHEGHAAGTLPPDFDSALRLLEAVPHQPSCLVRSGHGFHAYWFLEKPWVLADDVERARARSLARRLQWAICRRAAEKGWSLDNTADLARVLRLPGSFNDKRLDPKPVELEYLDAARRYLRAHFDLLPEPPAPAVSRTEERRAKAGCRDRHGARLGEGGGPPAEFALVWDACSWVRWCYENQHRLSEKHWYALLGILGRCAMPEADGRQLAHWASCGYPTYSAAETDAKLDHALEAANPRTCAEIAEILGARDDHCSRCPHFGRIRSPIVLGRPTWNVDPPEFAAANPRKRPENLVGSPAAYRRSLPCV